MNNQIASFCRVVLSWWLILLAGMPVLKAQNRTPEENLALLESAFGGVGEQAQYAIQFEGIAFGLDRPTDIFSLPSYQIHRGGFLYVDDAKFEVQLGVVKALSDGTLMVMVDEIGKIMVIDSVREHLPAELQQETDIAQLLKQEFGNTNVQYLGKETIKGITCHKLRSSSGADEDMYSFYWIDTATEKLVLMADHHHGGFDSYWIREVGKVPANHNFSVRLPQAELTNFHGYEVLDLRFLMDDLLQTPPTR